MIGGIVIQGLKSAAKMVGRTALKAGSKISKSKIGRTVAKGVKNFGTRMAKNVKSKRWWGRAVRVLRSNRSMLGSVGRIGTALRRSGGFLGMFGKGLSIFDTDLRSPREFRKDIKSKERSIAALKRKRDNLIAKEVEVQKELEAPVVTEGITSSEEKLDALAKHLTLMKASLGVIREATIRSKMNLNGFESYQVKANARLSEAIDYGAQTNMKTLTLGLEDVKDNAKAIGLSSSESIVGEIGAKIDAIEEAKRAEAEFRKKNNWKKKLLDFTLFIADWVLNWPFKLAMIALKIGAFITAALALFYIANVVPIKALIKAGPLTVVKFIYAKLISFGTWLWGKIIGALSWLLQKIIGGFASYAKWITNALTNLPVVGGYFETLGDKIDSFEGTIKESIASLEGNVKEGLDFLGDKADSYAQATLDKATAAYKAEAKAKEEEQKDNHTAMNEDSPEGVSSNLNSKSTSTSNEKIEAEGKESTNKAKVDKIKGSSESGSASDTVEVDKEDSRSWYQKAGDAVTGTIAKGFDAGGQIAAGKNKKVEKAKAQVSEIYEASKESLVNKAEGVYSTSKEVVVNATETIKESDTYKSMDKESSKKMEEIKEAVTSLGNAVQHAVANQASSGGGGSKVSAAPTQKMNFEESANKFKSRT